MSGTWRLIDSGRVQPAQSAALDEAILDAHVEGLVPSTLHFYVRAVPTVSIGYFEKIGESVDLQECRRNGVAIVRRKSGGRSIFTDPGQLIYGLVLHETDLPAGREDSFRMICSAISRALRSMGVDASYRPLNDIEVAGRKISGNAQLRRKGSVLQHGTVIVDADVEIMDKVLKARERENEKASVPSSRISTLRALTGTDIDMDDLKHAIAREIGLVFKVAFEPAPMTSAESEKVAGLVKDYYSRDEWNLKF